MRELLMVRPDFYGVEYEINPWMSRQRPPSRERALEQWEGLRRVLTDDIGATVHLMEPQPGLPDLVFTANAGLVLAGPAVVHLLRDEERQGEEPLFRRRLE